MIETNGWSEDSYCKDEAIFPLEIVQQFMLIKLCFDMP